ncbi:MULTISPECIES: ABC transporter permease [unclassified Pseudarthrobacter]|uniref:ABC transporter permease n=1 Tax=unclassified Pseudarthrobacter TaxID=2647000 RepID=UPI003077DBF0
MFFDTIRTPRGIVGLVLTALVVLVAALGPVFAPHDPAAFVDIPFSGPGPDAPWGTDVLGRDVLSRGLDGGWQLLLTAFAAGGVGVLVGALAGIAAGYLRGAWDGTIMRLVDVLLSFPALVLALLLMSIAGVNTWLIVLAVAVGHAPQVARVMRSATLNVSERDFVRAAELTGQPRWRTIVLEILPNLTSPLMVELGLRITYSLVIISSLAFLGFGQAPPAPSWGIMINENRMGLIVNPWSVVVPVLLIGCLTIGFNLLTDAFAEVAVGVRRSRRARADADAEGSAGAAETVREASDA